MSKTVAVLAALLSISLSAAAADEHTLKKIYGNFNRDRDIRYNCCAGFSVSPQASGYPQTVAMSFVPSRAFNLKKVVLGVQHLGGPNSLNVSLRTDAGGIPGDVIQQFEVSNLPEFGACCETAGVKSKGIPLIAGARYWVVVEALGDTTGTWNQNSVHARGLWAVNRGLGWEPFIDIEAAFKVLGD